MNKLKFIITKITDREGNIKNNGRYPLRIGRKCNLDLRLICANHPLYINYCPDEGEDYSGTLRTSSVEDYGYFDNYFVVTTMNSIYYFQQL